MIIIKKECFFKPKIMNLSQILKINKNHGFYTKKSHSASSTYNMKKGIICNYIPNMKALAQVLIEKNKKIK